MADRNVGGITGKGSKNINELYKQVEKSLKKFPTKTWGAGDPDYVKKMVESGKATRKSK